MMDSVAAVTDRKFVKCAPVIDKRKRKGIRHFRNSLFEKVISHLVVARLQRKRSYFAQGARNVRSIDRSADRGAFSEKHDTMNTTMRKNVASSMKAY